MNNLYKKALSLGASSFGKSKVKNKRYYVIYNDKIINFGSSVGNTYIDHKDKVKRKNWYARHSKIYNKAGKQVINDPKSPSYWSARILW